MVTVGGTHAQHRSSPHPTPNHQPHSTPTTKGSLLCTVLYRPFTCMHTCICTTCTHTRMHAHLRAYVLPHHHHNALGVRYSVHCRTQPPLLPQTALYGTLHVVQCSAIWLPTQTGPISHWMTRGLQYMHPCVVHSGSHASHTR